MAFQPDRPSAKRLRITIFQVVIAAAFLALAARIYVIQFVNREQYLGQAAENRFDEVSIPATRGIVVDRNGVQLAVNTASANVAVTPALLPEDSAQELLVLERLAGLLGIPFQGELNTVDERGIPEQSLLEMVREGESIAPYKAVIVARDIDHETARMLISEHDSFPGVEVEWVSVRQYPTGALTSHLIGYMGPIPEDRADEFEAQGYVLDRDRIGYDGIEFSLQDLLAGQPGSQIVERDVAGEIVRTVGDSVAPQDGYSVRLTLDVELQRAAQEALVDMIDQLKEQNPDNPIGYDRGVVIASNPRTGEILAMVSWPTYDNSRFARAIDYPYYAQVSQDPLRPLFNQAVNSLYPPGSIFKLITATAVLEENVVSPDYRIFDPGEIQLENRYYPNDPGQAQTFVCWLEQGHGEVDMLHAIAWSCDVYFYKVGGGYKEEVPEGLGILRLGEWMRIFGLGQQTGIELAGENEGFIPDPTWKRRVWGENWSTGDTYNSAFGQGYILTTPLQMMTVLNTIINNGMQPRPTLIREVVDQDGQVVAGFEPEYVDIRDRIEEYWQEAYGEPYPGTLDETMRLVQEGMRAAVTIEGGTALPAQDDYLPYVPIAGKTGTAEFCDNIAAALDQCVPGNWPAHAWFLSYAPYGNPEIAVLAFIYNGGEGSSIALPVASQVMDAYFQLKAQRAVEAQATPTGTAEP
jgi:penicillin-binding protein 2